MSLDSALADYVSPHYTGIDDANSFWNRSQDYMTSNSDIEQLLRKAENEGTKGKVLARLEDITKQNFDTFGKKYFTGRSKLSTVARYAGLGANIMGGLSAAGGILAIAAGGPLSAVAARGYGLGWLLTGGAINTGADLYDAMRMKNALAEGNELEGRHYMSKEDGTWRVVSKPGVLRPLAEGLAENAIARFGPQLIDQYLGMALGGITPYAQIASMGASGIAFYRGGKKFDDQVIQYVQEKSLDQLLGELGQVVPIPKRQPLKDRLPKYDAYHTDDHVYDALQGKQPKQGYIVPRKAA